MKLACLAVVALCACAHAAVLQKEAGDSVKITHLGFQTLHLKASSPETEISQDDQLLSAELAQLEEIENRNIIADAIQNLLNSFRPIIVNGNDILPPLDPLVINSIGPVEFSTTGVRVTMSINDFNMQGLQWYVVDNVTFNTLRLQLGMNLVLPFFTFTGSYDARARIALIPYNAGGDFRVFVNRIDVDVDTRLGTNILGGGGLILRELDIRIAIHDITVNIDGLLGSGILNNLINSAVESITQGLLTGELNTLSDLLSEALFDGINEILGNFTLDDLLGLGR